MVGLGDCTCRIFPPTRTIGRAVRSGEKISSKLLSINRRIFYKRARGEFAAFGQNQMLLCPMIRITGQRRG